MERLTPNLMYFEYRSKYATDLIINRWHRVHTLKRRDPCYHALSYDIVAALKQKVKRRRRETPRAEIDAASDVMKK